MPTETLDRGMREAAAEAIRTLTDALVLPTSNGQLQTWIERAEYRLGVALQEYLQARDVIRQQAETTEPAPF